MKTHRLLFMIHSALVLLLFASCDAEPSKSPQVQAIRKRGALMAGVEMGVRNFGYTAPGSSVPEGFEIDLARIVAKEITGNENAIKFFPIMPSLRGPLLDNDEVDIVISSFTITEERKERYNFTSPYYTDEVGFMLRKDSGIADITGLDGKRIGVVREATTRQAVEEEAGKRNIRLDFVEFANQPEIMAALLVGKIDSFACDKIILRGFLDNATVILSEGFCPQPYGIAVKKSNDKLAEYLESIIKAMQTDGRLEALSTKWGL
jgi:putative glutamine transport system substrate-binding protein